MENINLRFWQNKGQLQQIAKAAEIYFNKLYNYLQFFNTKIDALSAPLELVELLAWQRDIERFPTEDEALYRKRVHFAMANAIDAGSVKGFKNIWERLELGEISQAERISDDDWDVITLTIDEYIFGKYAGLFEMIIAQYGRTCRRYVFVGQTNINVGVNVWEYEHENFYTIAGGE